MIDQQRKARDMQRARSDLDAAIEALQQAREVLGNATWMRDRHPAGHYLWREGCDQVFRLADLTRRTVLLAAQTGIPE